VTTSDPGKGLALQGYLALSRGIPLLAPTLLNRRLARGKELPDRWREKLGEPTLSRPDGPLIWLHAVGLGETLALRGLIAALAEQAPAAQFLVTSTTRGSAEVLAQNLPPRTRHQFLPLDAPAYLNRFLDHWRPSLSIWAEQDLWPGAVTATAARGIPLALVNARMNAEAYARRARWKGLYANLFARFALITAQDETTARHLQALGAKGVSVTGSLKAAAPPLTADPARTGRRRVRCSPAFTPSCSPPRTRRTNSSPSRPSVPLIRAHSSSSPRATRIGARKSPPVSPNMASPPPAAARGRGRPPMSGSSTPLARWASGIAFA